MHGETLVYTRRQRHLVTPEIQNRFPNSPILRTPVQIQTLRAGDEVLSKSKHDNQLAFRRVLQVQRYSAGQNETYDIDYILPEAKEGREDSAHAYPHGDQQFWTRQRGWQQARQLVVGDHVMLMNGAVAIVEQHRLTQGEALLYNLIVEDFGTYFVTGLGIWVEGLDQIRHPLLKSTETFQFAHDSEDIELQVRRYEFLLPPHEVAARILLAKNGVQTTVLPDGREGQPKNNLGKNIEGRVRGHPRFLDDETGLVMDVYSPEPDATLANVMWMIAECKTRRHSSSLILDLRRNGLSTSTVSAAIDNYPAGIPGLGRLLSFDSKLKSATPIRGTGSEFEPYAKDFLRWVKEKKGIELDYDDETVRWLDQFLLQYRPQGEIDENLLVATGSVLGECLYRKFGGEWEDHPEHGWMFKICAIMGVYPFGLIRRHVENKYGDTLFGIYSGYEELLEKKILEFLCDGPQGLEVKHTPDKVVAKHSEENAYYLWEFETSLSSQNKAVVLEFGALNWSNGRWRFSNSGKQLFRRQQFAEWYGCEAGVLEPGRVYKDTSNWLKSYVLESGRVWWFFFAVDQRGKIVKGDAIVEKLDQLASADLTKLNSAQPQPTSPKKGMLSAFFRK